MKIIKYFLPKIIVIAFTIISCSQPLVQENIIDVPDYRDKPLPTSDLESHKNHDVKIYRGGSLLGGYTVVLYHNITGELLDYFAFYSTPTLYNKASYHWQDESTIIIKFFNSETKLESSIELQVSGDSEKRMLDIKDRS